jgi:hypothetical protein
VFRIRILEAKKLTDLTDPDPEHWSCGFNDQSHIVSEILEAAGETALNNKVHKTQAKNDCRETKKKNSYHIDVFYFKC